MVIDMRSQGPTIPGFTKSKKVRDACISMLGAVVGGHGAGSTPRLHTLPGSQKKCQKMAIDIIAARSSVPPHLPIIAGNRMVTEPYPS
jgi:hypothetical protein